MISKTLVMKKYLSILILVSCCFIGCEKSRIKSTESNNCIESHISETIPVEKALASLDQLLLELYGTTKSSDGNYTIDVFGGIKTKSSPTALPDTTLYIVNRENGYAILSAQSKIKTDVFCITDSGSISAVDIENAILQFEDADINTRSFEDEEDYFEDMGRNTIPSIIAASTINQLYYDREPEYAEYETKSNSYTGTPVTLAMLQTKWHQLSPFNDFRTDGSPAGCVAIATAQIIEFNALNHGYNHFTIDNNKSFDWNKLFTVCHCSNISYSGLVDAEKEASDFLKYVGLNKNCKIRYDVNGSGGYADGAKRTFVNMGYKSVKKYLGFEKADKNRAISQLTSGFPMYMDGSGPGAGHAWVLDGIYVRKVYGETGDYLRTENLFHINWGWNGLDDGYYSQGVFDTSQRPDTEFGVDPGTVSIPSSKYTWNYRTVTYTF